MLAVADQMHLTSTTGFQIWDPSKGHLIDRHNDRKGHGGPVWNRGRMDTASSSRVDGRLDRTFSASASASGGSCFCFAKLGMGGLRWSILLHIAWFWHLFLSWICWRWFFIFSSGKSTMTGESIGKTFLFFGASLSKSMLLTVNIPINCRNPKIGLVDVGWSIA